MLILHNASKRQVRNYSSTSGSVREDTCLCALTAKVGAVGVVEGNEVAFVLRPVHPVTIDASKEPNCGINLAGSCLECDMHVKKNKTV